MSQIFAKNIKATHTHFPSIVSVFIVVYVCELNILPPSGLTTGTMTEVGVALLPVVPEASVTGGPTETGQSLDQVRNIKRRERECVCVHM